MNCPLCREPFILPHGGVLEIKKYFKMGKWLNIRKLSAGKAMCEEHNEEIRMFCRECRVGTCVTCYIKSHNTHKCADIAELSDVLSDKQKASELCKITEDIIERVRNRKETNDVIEHLVSIENEINTAADKVIAAVECEREKLLSQVESIRQKEVKDLETLEADLEQHATALRMFIKDSETLLSSETTAGDVKKSLHDRTEDLTKFDVVNHVERFLSAGNVIFNSSTLLEEDVRNLVGTIAEKS